MTPSNVLVCPQTEHIWIKHIHNYDAAIRELWLYYLRNVSNWSLKYLAINLTYDHYLNNWSVVPFLHCSELWNNSLPRADSFHSRWFCNHFLRLKSHQKIVNNAGPRWHPRSVLKSKAQKVFQWQCHETENQKVSSCVKLKPIIEIVHKVKWSINQVLIVAQGATLTLFHFN